MDGELTEAAVLTTTDVEALRARGRVRHLRPGETFCCEGELPGAVGYLLRGHVKLTRRTPSGNEAMIAVRGPSSLVGEVAAIDTLPREVTITALDEVESIVVEVSEFRRYIGARPRVALRLLEILAGRIRETERSRASADGRPALDRVAARLVEAVDSGTVDDAVRIPLDQRELASWVGASRESTNRALAILRRQRLITTGRGSITICDLDGLRRVVTATVD